MATADKNLGTGPTLPYLAAFIGALGGLLFGFDTGIIAGAMLFVQNTFTLSTSAQEWIVSSVVLGAFVSCLFSGKLADRYGRKTMLIAVAAIFTIGTLLTTFANNVFSLILGRLIIGVAIGISSYTVPLFISEIAPSSYRGTLVLFNAITITGGQAAAFLVALYFSLTQNWRAMFAVGLIPAMLLFIGMFFAPRTPRWLILSGAIKKAESILKKLRATSDVSNELREIESSISAKQSTFLDLFSKKLRPVLIIGIGLGIFQQAMGINTIIFYGPTIFKFAGFQHTSAEILATFGLSATNLLMSIIAAIFIDKLGRRSFLLAGTLLAGISLITLSVFYTWHAQAQWIPWVTIASLFSYMVGYCLSTGTLFWLIISEIYPLAIRGQAMSFVTAIQWAANFLVAATFLSIVNVMGLNSTFLMYGVICLLCYFFVYFLVPETKQVSLETIEKNLQLGKTSRSLGQSS